MIYFRSKKVWFILGALILFTIYISVSVIKNSRSPVTCLSSKQVTNQTTPVTLYPAALQCFKENKIDEGMFLYIIAILYAGFDNYQVEDKHLAYKIRKQLSYMTWKQEAAYHEAMGKLWRDYSGGLPKLYKICHELQRIGMPDYYPAYMIPDHISQRGYPQGLLSDAELIEKEGRGLIEKWKGGVNIYCSDIEDRYPEVKE